MENLNKNHANCQFEMDIPADVLAYINGEHISQADIRNVIAKVLSKFEIPKSGSRNFFRSRKNDLGVMCKFHYCEEEKTSIELIFVFRLSAKELNFSYKGKNVHIFYSADDDTISFNEKSAAKKKFDSSDGFATVLSYLDKLTASDKDEDLILEDIITLCLWRHMKGDVLQLEIIAAPLAVHNVD